MTAISFDRHLSVRFAPLLALAVALGGCNWFYADAFTVMATMAPPQLVLIAHKGSPTVAAEAGIVVVQATGGRLGATCDGCEFEDEPFTDKTVLACQPRTCDGLYYLHVRSTRPGAVVHLALYEDDPASGCFEHADASSSGAATKNDSFDCGPGTAVADSSGDATADTTQAGQDAVVGATSGCAATKCAGRILLVRAFELDKNEEPVAVALDGQGEADAAVADSAASEVSDAKIARAVDAGLAEDTAGEDADASAADSEFADLGKDASPSKEP